MQITVSVNGEEHTRDIEPRLLLVHLLRDEIGLTGTHWGCDTSNCGACVVLMDGEPAKSCTVLAATAENYEITTVEGLERDGVLDPVQVGFHVEHGLQCGFCTPGMLLTARALAGSEPVAVGRRRSASRSRARSAAARATRRSCARSAGRRSTRTARPERRPAGAGERRHCRSGWVRSACS